MIFLLLLLQLFIEGFDSIVIDYNLAKDMGPKDFYSDPQKMLAALANGNPNFPMPNLLHLAEAQTLVIKRSHAIFADREVLLAILDRYEETLRKRWAKKTGEQRRKVLLKNMPAMHRPDFEALRRENMHQTRTATRFRDSFLLPSLNLEDLLTSKKLLMFLNARGRHDPDTFSNADFNSIHLANTSQAILPAYISNYTMFLAGQKTPSTYGHLVS